MYKQKYFDFNSIFDRSWCRKVVSFIKCLLKIKFSVIEIWFPFILKIHSIWQLIEARQKMEQLVYESFPFVFKFLKIFVLHYYIYLFITGYLFSILLSFYYLFFILSSNKRFVTLPPLNKKYVYLWINLIVFAYYTYHAVVVVDIYDIAIL